MNTEKDAEREVRKLIATLKKSVEGTEKREKLESYLFDSGTMETGITVESTVTDESEDFYIMLDAFDELFEDWTTEDIEQFISEHDSEMTDLRILNAREMALDAIASNGFSEE